MGIELAPRISHCGVLAPVVTSHIVTSSAFIHNYQLWPIQPSSDHGRSQCLLLLENTRAFMLFSARGKRWPEPIRIACTSSIVSTTLINSTLSGSQAAQMPACSRPKLCSKFELQAYRSRVVYLHDLDGVFR